jgi:hypothetical protein
MRVKEYGILRKVGHEKGNEEYETMFLFFNFGDIQNMKVEKS